MPVIALHDGRELMRDFPDGLTSEQAMDLLSDVSWGDEQMGTQWSVVYDMYNGEINVVMGRQYKDPHAFQLPLQSGFPIP